MNSHDELRALFRDAFGAGAADLDHRLETVEQGLTPEAGFATWWDRHRGELADLLERIGVGR